jgi:hypothetical protein
MKKAMILIMAIPPNGTASPLKKTEMGEDVETLISGLSPNVPCVLISGDPRSKMLSTATEILAQAKIHPTAFSFPLFNETNYSDEILELFAKGNLNIEDIRSIKDPAFWERYAAAETALEGISHEYPDKVMCIGCDPFMASALILERQIEGAEEKVPFIQPYIVLLSTPERISIVTEEKVPA